MKDGTIIMSWPGGHVESLIEATSDLYNVQEIFQDIKFTLTEERDILKKKLGFLGMVSIRKDPELKELNIVIVILDNILRNVNEAIQNTECIY